MLRLLVRAQTVAGAAVDRLREHRRSSDSGQTTTEYALVTLGAAAVALLVTAWAGRTGKIGDLLDAVVDRVMGRV
jgi:hypothetical protein